MSKLSRKVTSWMIIVAMGMTSLPSFAASEAIGGHYGTNPSGYGKAASITVDGKAEDWTADMLIAQGVANDDARSFRGTHEGPVYDTYSLYGAWDDENLYLMWQFVNVTDVIDPAQGYPISDNGKPSNGDIPQIIALSIDPNKSGNGQCINGDVIDDSIWGIKVNYETPVDTLLYFSSKPGVGQPSIFKVNDEGYFDYDTAVGFKEAGITYQYGDGLQSGITSVMGIKANGYEGYTPADLYGNTSFSWVNMLEEGHDPAQDTLYEMAIPLSALGIDRAYLEKNGIGAMHISTFGQSGIASIPQEPSMLDVATEGYSADESTSAEKEDQDMISVPLAEIGAKRTTVSSSPSPSTSPSPTTSPSTSPSPTTSPSTSPSPTTSPSTSPSPTISPSTSPTILPVSELGNGSSSAGGSGSSAGGLASEVGDGTILHAWNWSLKTIKEKLPEIAAAGYTSVQTSPLQGTKESSMGGSKWWVLYQPTNFAIGNAQLGTRDDLIELCKAADEYGIKIVVDVIFNHTANLTGDDISPMVDSTLRTNSDFWHYPLTSVSDWSNRWQVTHQDVGGLPDLNTSNKDLQAIIINYLQDLVACGVDGFRVDTAKHIELPSDSDGSDFWPTITGALNNVFLYGEVLQGGASNYYNYSPYMHLTASQYGFNVRGAVGFGETQNVNNAIDYSSEGVNADHLVTFVETHDNYSNDGCESTYMTDWQIKMGWAIIASRAYVAPLYFNRPTESATNSKFAALLGTAGNDNWKDADVVAVNAFHNAMVGEGENLKALNNGLLMIERGTKGAVLVNLGASAQLNQSTQLADGVYTNHGSQGGSFTVSKGVLTGTAPAGGIVVLYNEAVQNGTPKVSIKADSATYYDEIQVTLGAEEATTATYSINGGAETSYTNGQTLTLGAEAAYNSLITLTVKATNAEGTSTTSCNYIKLDPNGKAVAYFDNTAKNWANVNAYVYDDTSSTEVTQVEKWPGVAMSQNSEGIYAYEIPDTIAKAKVIFNNGDSEQVPGAQESGYEVKAPMIYNSQGWCYYLMDEVKNEMPTVSISPAEGNFTGDSLTLTLGVQKAESATYSVNGGAANAYSDGQTLTLTGIEVGAEIKVTLTATSSEGTTTKTYTYTNVDVVKPTVKEGEFKAFFYKPTSWGDNINAYVYDESGSSVKQNGAWPGLAMTDEGNGLYSYTLDETWKNAYIIFNDGNSQIPASGQTGYLLDGSRYYEEGNWYVCEVVADSSAKVFISPEAESFTGESLELILGVSGDVVSATYTTSTGETGSYENGQVLTIGADVNEGTTITVTLTAIDAAGKEVSASYDYVKEAILTMPTAYFYKPSNWGSELNIYIYDDSQDSVKEVASWPGVSMTSEGDDLYSYTLPEGWSFAKVIFNDGNNQTPGAGQSGLELSQDMIYNNGTWEVK